MDPKYAEICRVRLERFLERIAPLRRRETVLFMARFAHCPTPVPIADRTRLSYRPIAEGEVWGAAWESGWFHLTGKVPVEWRGRPVAAWIDLGGEGLVTDASGRILQGISSGSIWAGDFQRELVPLFAACAGGEPVELWVEGAASSLFGVHTEIDPGSDCAHRYGHFTPVAKRMRLVCLDEEAHALWLDLSLVHGLVQRLPERSTRRARCLRAAMEAIDRFRDTPAHASAARAVLVPELSQPSVPSELTAVAVGHAHIDTAWLWPVAETIRKCARTFASQLALLDAYPEYVFGASQAQHFAFVRDHYPELYARVREAIAAGRFEVQGGMWVEADCNLPSGESLIRQILHGKNFFRDEFGVEVDHLWLPDVFGYSPALPQILRRSGLRFFLTQKLSWNQTNDFPHTTFRWRGLDGSEVIAHFPPENTYNSLLSSASLIAGAENFREKEILDEFLCLFGVGDGGGGPKEESIEWGRRMRNLEGAPRVRFGTVRDFFARLEPHASKLPVWSGELYLELHRGTLTTQARIKADNRRLEGALRDVEFLWSCLPLADYPAARLDAIWKTVLRNQFHDILPGSSITRVYADARREHAECLEACRELREEAAARLSFPDADSLLLVNSLSTAQRQVLVLPEEWRDRELVDSEMRPCLMQRDEECTLALVEVPGASFITLRRGRPLAANARRGEGLTLENDRARYRFAADGTLIEGADRPGQRSILAPGTSGNLLTLYEDRPNHWDAWDVDRFYEDAVIEHARAIDHAPLPRGPVRQGLRFRLAIGSSEITQTVTLTEGSPRLDFRTEVVWRESHKMLRVAFPVNVRAEHAAFDVAYGFVHRPTHRNTSWDEARFEVAAHRYVDLSEPTHGVALLNDSKYGHKVLGSIIDLNLLRSPTHPDPDADRGAHCFTYSLYPHGGDLAGSDVIAHAAALNQGLMAFYGRAGDGSPGPPVRLTGEGASVEALKKAEREDSWIIRVVETHGRGMRAALQVAGPVQGLKVAETDLMEWNDGPLHSLERPFDFELRPFEVRTFRILRS